MSILGSGVQAQVLHRQKLELEYQIAIKTNTKDYWTECVGEQEYDISRYNSGVSTWNSAVKADKSNENKEGVDHYANRKTAYKDSSVQFAKYVGYRVSQDQKQVILQNRDYTWDSGYEEAKKESVTWLAVIQGKEKTLDMELENLESQLTMVDTQLKSFQQLHQNDTKNDTVLWCVGGG